MYTHIMSIYTNRTTKDGEMKLAGISPCNPALGVVERTAELSAGTYNHISERISDGYTGGDGVMYEKDSAVRYQWFVWAIDEVCAPLIRIGARPLPD